FVFFFSSRRRHTRWPRNWSSDVCSSDLLFGLAPQVSRLGQRPEVARSRLADGPGHLDLAGVVGGLGQRPRAEEVVEVAQIRRGGDRKSTRLNSSHVAISYAVFCLKKKKD